MSVLAFVVDGAPVPYKRVQRGHGRAWVPARMRAYMDQVAEDASVALASDGVVDWPVDGAYRVEVVSYMPTRRAIDVDNLGKIVLDALNGVLWRDDSQVRRLEIEKRYDRKHPRAVVRIEVMG